MHIYPNGTLITVAIVLSTRTSCYGAIESGMVGPGGAMQFHMTSHFVCGDNITSPCSSVAHGEHCTKIKGT